MTKNQLTKRFTIYYMLLTLKNDHKKETQIHHIYNINKSIQIPSLVRGKSTRPWIPAWDANTYLRKICDSMMVPLQTAKWGQLVE